MQICYAFLVSGSMRPIEEPEMSTGVRRSATFMDPSGLPLQTLCLTIAIASVAPWLAKSGDGNAPFKDVAKPKHSSKKVFLVVSCPEKGPDKNGGFSDPVMKHLHNARDESGYIHLGFDFAGSTCKQKGDEKIWNKISALSEELNNLSGWAKMDKLSKVEKLLKDTRWWTVYIGGVKKAIQIALQSKNQVVVSCIEGGPITQIEQRNIVRLKDEVIEDLKCQQFHARVEIQVFPTFEHFQTAVDIDTQGNYWENRLAKQQNEVDHQQLQLQQEQKRLQERKRKVEQHKEKINKESKKLNEEQACLQQEKEQIKLERHQLNLELKALHDDCEDSKRKKEALVKKEKDVQEKEEKIAEEERELHEKYTKLDQTQKDIEEQQTDLLKSESELNNQMLDLQNKLEQYEQQAQMMELLKIQINHQTQQNVKLTQELHQIWQEKKEATDQAIEEQTSLIEELKSRIASFEKEATAAKEQVAQEPDQTKLTELNGRIKNLEGEKRLLADQLEEKKEAADKTIEEQKSLIDELRSRIESFEKGAAAPKEQVAQEPNTTELAELNGRIKKLEDEKRELANRLEEKKKANDKIIEEQNSLIEELRSRIGSFEKEADAAIEQVAQEQDKTELAELNGHTKKLDDEMREVADGVEKAKETMKTLPLYKEVKAAGRSLNLEKRELTDEDLSPLSEALQHNAILEGLNLSRNQIEDLSPLSEALKRNRVLRRVFLTGNKIEDLAPIAEALKINKSLQALSLSCNGIKDLTPLSEALKQNIYLKELYLQHNPIKDGGGDLEEVCRQKGVKLYT